MTDYTANFNLEKYQTGDAANLNDQYNASMDIIDVSDLKSNHPPTVGLNPSGIDVSDLKSKEPPTVGLNPSGIDVSDLKSKKPPTVGLNPSGIDVSDLKSKEPPTVGLNPSGIECIVTGKQIGRAHV